MARIRGLIHTHIGMINSIEALLVTLDLWFTRKPQHFPYCAHTFTFLVCIWLLFAFTLHHYFQKPNFIPLHHTLSKSHTSLFPLLTLSILARVLDHTQTTKGLRSPSILVGTTIPLHNLLTPYFDGSSNGAAAGDLGLILSFMVVLVEILTFFCFCLHTSLLCCLYCGISLPSLITI